MQCVCSTHTLHAHYTYLDPTSPLNSLIHKFSISFMANSSQSFMLSLMISTYLILRQLNGSNELQEVPCMCSAHIQFTHHTYLGSIIPLYHLIHNYLSLSSWSKFSSMKISWVFIFLSPQLLASQLLCLFLFILLTKSMLDTPKDVSYQAYLIELIHRRIWILCWNGSTWNIRYMENIFARDWIDIRSLCKTLWIKSHMLYV